MDRPKRSKDANVHADHPTAARPNRRLHRTWCRDVLDDRPVHEALERLSRRRGLAAVRDAVSRWLREVR